MTYQQPTNYNKHFDVSISAFATADSDGMGIVTVVIDKFIFIDQIQNSRIKK